MSTALFEAFLAKIYVDAKARTEFLSDPLGEAQRAGLSPEEAAGTSEHRLGWAEAREQEF